MTIEESDGNKHLQSGASSYETTAMEKMGGELEKAKQPSIKKILFSRLLSSPTEMQMIATETDKDQKTECQVRLLWKGKMNSTPENRFKVIMCNQNMKKLQNGAQVAL